MFDLFTVVDTVRQRLEFDDSLSVGSSDWLATVSIFTASENSQDLFSRDYC
jgi:hypothetical protein